ncbi:MAG: hypothetical protein ACETVV_01095 [Nitrososphaeria archaeon]
MFEREPFEGMLALAKNLHPREFIALLRGEVRAEETYVKELLLAPLSVYGAGFSNFNPYAIPFDASLVGLVHSHPSGRAGMSTWDYNHFYGSIMVIAAYPYGGAEDVAAFDGRGNRLNIRVNTRS